MAVQPTLQWLCEAKLVRATHGVITNCRPDDLDVMGPTDADAARALCGMVPPRGKLFTAEAQHLPILQDACTDRQASCMPWTPRRWQITDAEMQAFSYTEHRENVALALAVCADLNVARDIALQGMRRAAPDAGALTEYEVNFFGRRLVFVNGFAANDPVSTASIWATMVHKHQKCATRIAVFNCRDDLPDRSVQLVKVTSTGPPPTKWCHGQRLLLVRARRHSRRCGSRQVGVVERESVDEILKPSCRWWAPRP